MCYGHVDSRYTMRDIEARMRHLARPAEAEPQPARQGRWLAGGLAAILTRIADLMARPGRVTGPRA
jgi:hypothetical protein